MIHDTLKSQANSDIYFVSSIKDEVNQSFRAMTTQQILNAKSIVEKFFTEGRPLSQTATGLSQNTIRDIEEHKEQRMGEDDKQHSKRIKKLSTQVSSLWLEGSRKRWEKIDSLLDSRDRIKKLIQLLLCHSNTSGFNKLTKQLTGKSLVADCRTNSSINQYLREALRHLNENGLAKLEEYEPHYLALFEDKDFLFFIEHKSRLLDLPTYKYIEQLECIYNSLSRLDHLRIYIELTHMQEFKNTNETYNKILLDYDDFKKDLKSINKALAGIQRPKKAALKELITTEGFSINENTGARILLSTKGKRVIKGIERVIRNEYQKSFRKTDNEIEKNFTVYNFLNSELNPCDFIKNKKYTINKLIDDFIKIKNISEVIASNKKSKYKKGTRQITVRMPKSTNTAIKVLAKKNNISQQLLLNIIIQHSSKDIQASGKDYYDQTVSKKIKIKTASSSSAEIPPSNTENPTSFPEQEDNVPVSSTIKGQPLLDKKPSAVEPQPIRSSEPQKKEPQTKNRKWTKPQTARKEEKPTERQSWAKPQTVRNEEKPTERQSWASFQTSQKEKPPQ